MPQELTSRQEIRQFIQTSREKGQTVGFVPTMGYLHEGHASLLRQARLENDLVILSIYINPLQFGPEEDFEQYPRDKKKDFELARETGTDAILTLSEEPMYSPEHATYVEVKELTDHLCGASRPGHFRGVTTIVTKLFGLVSPDRAYFGQKDAQQAIILRRMTIDLEMNTKIRILPIVRESDGLALSSRNVYLDEKQRQEALGLHRSLLRAQELVASGERCTETIDSAVRDILNTCDGAQIDYIGLVDSQTLQPVERLERETLLALAVHFGRTRLIDNTLLTPLA
ncbi:MAG: pantoate--beta-alanine ligase [Planctomycetota bacterium]|nr:pantoate--beta-alanine ligase [Planctomycetota bacterium]